MPPETVDDARIDRLVDGELADAERRELLRALDASPDGWRRCALAFLEAQAFRSALSGLDRAAPRTSVPTPRRRPHLGAWVARAAVILLAFGVGWMVHRPHVVVAPAEVPGPPVVADGAETSPVPPPPPASPPPADFVRGKLEREGYRVEQRLLLLPAETQDGRRGVVPVRRMEVRYVGNRAV